MIFMMNGANCNFESCCLCPVYIEKASLSNVHKVTILHCKHIEKNIYLYKLWSKMQTFLTCLKCTPSKHESLGMMLSYPTF